MIKTWFWYYIVGKSKQNFTNYLSYFIFAYLVICHVLGAIAVLLGLLGAILISIIPGINFQTHETDALGPIGFAFSIVFLTSIPIAIVVTIWSAPTEDNMVKDLTTQYKRLGPTEGARILTESNLEDTDNN